MNILDAEDMIKGLPDQALMQQAQMPTGELPQFLVISEIQRRSDMRKRHEARMQEQPQGTVKDQIMREGIAAMMPQQPMGMPPQMMPQGMPPQGRPQMPPQGMPPQGMPPMGMAAGGIVRMQGGGFLDQYVAGAEAGPMPGGSTIRDQLDRLLESGMSYPEILSFVSKTFYGRPEVLEYVQSKVGRPEPTMGSDGVRERRSSIDTDALISGMVSERVGDRPRMGDVTASDIYGGSFALGEIDLGMPTREQAAAADRAAVERIRSQLSPSISGGDIDEAVAGMVSERAPRSGGIPSLSTAPQRGAGGRPFDFNIDLGMPTREQAIMADRAAVADMRSNLSPSLGSIDASDIDRSIAGMVSERAPRSGGIGRLFGFLTSDDKRSGTDLFGTGFGGAEYSSPKPGVESADPISEMLALAQSVQTDASDPRRESKSLAEAGILSGSTPSEIAAQLYDYSRPTSGARGRPVEGSPSREELIYSTLGEDYSGFMPPVLAGPAARQKFIDEVVASGRLDDRFATDLFGTGFGGADYSQVPSSDVYKTAGAGGAEVQGASPEQAQSLGFDLTPENIATIDALQALAKGSATRKGAESGSSDAVIDDPMLDLSDIIAQSERMAKANALMQLGAGIAEGSVAKGLSAAGIAATQGMQDARALEMKKRLAEYQAGREDIRRGEEADRFERKMEMEESQFGERIKVMREEITAKLGISKNANNREVLQSIDNALKVELNPERKAELLEMRSIMSSILSPELMAIMGQDAPTRAVSFDTLRTG